MNPNQRLGLETALAFWNLLLPHGYSEGALTTSNAREGNDDVDMDGNVSGWKEEYTQWWFEFLTEKKLKGVSKDTWLMVSHSFSPLSKVSENLWAREQHYCVLLILPINRHSF